MKFSNFNIDKEYILSLRHQLHMYPEVGFDLPNTVALVKDELEKIGITYTEKYGKSSIVATINDEKRDFTIGIRADMDALHIQEKVDLPFKSKIDGVMHACGHDAHTAMLLGTAKALYAIRNEINCRIKLLFQPSEEGPESGAKMMLGNGVMDGIDVIIGLHTENWLPAGTVGVCCGMSMASSRTFAIEFFGKTAHAVFPQSGKDALAMAVKTYGSIQHMLTREIDPFAKYVCSISTLNAGATQNVIADYAEMKGTIRTYDTQLDEYLINRINAIVKNTADEVGAEGKVISSFQCFPVYNDPVISDLVIKSAEKVVGKNHIAEMPIKMSSEDFSYYLTSKPGVLFRLGTKDIMKEHVSLLHNNDFDIVEDVLYLGSAVCVQFVLDNMDGIANTIRGCIY